MIPKTNAKILSVIIVAVMLILSLVGCTGSSIGGADGPTTMVVDNKKENENKNESNQDLNDLDSFCLVKAETPEAYGYDDFDKMMELRERYQLDDNFTAAVRDFSKKTTAVLENKGENLVYSPLSLYYALSILATGATNEAQAELTAVLGCEKSELAEQCEGLYRLIYDDNEIGKTKLSNSLWVDKNKGVSFKQDWLDRVSRRFFAPVFEVDFNDELTGNLIGQWISENTDGLLEYNYQPDPIHVMSIINTVLLTDQWDDLFNEEHTAPALFTNLDGSTSECDFMNKTELGSFYKSERYTLCSLSLKNGGAVSFILPAKGIDAQSMLYDDEVYSDLFTMNDGQSNRGFGEIIWKVPKFTCESELDLVTPLRSLGVNGVFDTTNALKDISEDDLYVSGVVQNARLGINEKGIEAAAYTEILMCGSALPTDSCEMILDRPFAYIVTADNNIPLFVGVVNEIK